MKYLAHRARNGTTAKRLLALALALALASLLLAGCTSGETGTQNKSEEEENDGGNVASAAQPSEVTSGDDRPVEEVAAELGPSVVQLRTWTHKDLLRGQA